MRIRSGIYLNQDFLFDKFPFSRYNLLSLFFGLGLWYIASNNQNIEIDQYRYLLVQKMQEKEIRWKTSLLLLSIYLCLFIFLTGCDKNRMGIPDPPEPLPGLPSISDRLVTRIYFDATLSMQGFVVPGSTHYTQICPYLESVIVSGWRDGKVDFFRFGERVESIDRSTYLQAGYESFYEQAHIFRRTYIEEVIRHEEQVNVQMEANRTPEGTAETDVNDTPEATQESATPTETVNARKKEAQLVIIVTDLFQDDSDITLLIDHLKGKYIKKGREVGLFGLRSQFDGTVYDIGIGEGSSLRYRGTRPFYLLVLGRHADIAHYFDRLKVNNPDAKTIIFSRYLVNPLVSFDGASIDKLDNLNNTTSISSEDPRLKQYEIVRSSEPAKISAKLKYEPLPHAMSFDTDTFKSFISAKHAPLGKTEINRDAQKCLEVISTLSKSEGDRNELRVDFSLDSPSLPGKAVYLYEVTLKPGIDTYRAPDWCSEWDMENRRDGSKTLNLVNFVRDLSQVTARMYPPKIAQFRCYIGKR